MATTTKLGTGTDLSLLASWSPSIPTINDTAIFNSTSLGTNLTGSVSIGTLQFDGAAGNVNHGTGTITLGSGGWVFAATNNRTWTESDDIAVGSTDQTWSLYNTTANTPAIILSGAGGNITGTATITLQRTGGSGRALFRSIATAVTFDGILALGDNTGYDQSVTAGTGTGAGLGNAATIRVDGTGTAITSSAGTSTIPSDVLVNNSFDVGSVAQAGTVVLTGGVAFGSAGAYTLTTQVNTTIQTGALNMGTNSHVLTTNGATTVSSTVTLPNTPYSGTLQTGTATLALSGAVNFGTGNHLLTTGGAALTVSGATNVGTTRPTISAQNGNITLSGVISGSTDQINISSVSPNTVTVSNTGNTYSGTVALLAGSNSGTLVLGGTLQSGNVFPNLTALSIANGGSPSANTLRVISNAAFTAPYTLSADGNVLVSCTAAGGVSFTALSQDGSANASIGFGVWANATNSYLNLASTNVGIPAKLVYYLQGASPTGHITWNDASGSNYTTSSNLVLNNALAGTGNLTCNLYASGTSGSTLTVNGNVSTVGTGTFSFWLRGTNTGANTINGLISGTVNVSKNDAGSWTLTGNNTFSGAISTTAGTLIVTGEHASAGGFFVNGGVLDVRNALALGSSASNTTCFITGTLKISGGVSINKSLSALTIQAGSAIENVSGENTLTMASGNTVGTLAVTATAGSLTLPFAISGSASTAVSKTGTGTLKLTNATNSFTGATAISAGVLEISKIGLVGGGSTSLGNPVLAQATLTMGATGSATLRHVGTTADTTDRIISFTGAAGTALTLDSSGTGSGGMNFTSGGTLTFTVNGAHDLIFTGTNQTTNTFARAIGNATGGGATSIVKSGSNSWDLTGAVTSTGALTCSGGYLGLNANSLTSTSTTITGSGEVRFTSGSTLSSPVSIGAGILRTTVAGAGNTLTVTSAASESTPATLHSNGSLGSNTFTGNATISGCADLIVPITVSPATAGNGRVLGASNTVIVNGTGTIRTYTKSNSLQRGSARYNNLTFNSGSTLKIGFAA